MIFKISLAYKLSLNQPVMVCRRPVAEKVSFIRYNLTHIKIIKPLDVTIFLDITMHIITVH